MPKKSISKQSAIRALEDEDYESSMILLMKEDGERIYLHPFDDDLAALDFLETMVSSFRIDMLERVMRRSMN